VSPQKAIEELGLTLTAFEESLKQTVDAFRK